MADPSTLPNASTKRNREETSTPSVHRESKRPKPGPSTSFADVLSKMGREEPAETKEGDSLWMRPRALINASEDRIIFQHLDTRKSVSPAGDVTIQLFGSTKDGHSVLAHVTGFRHYFYYPTPEGFTRDHLEPLARYLNERIGGLAVESIDIEMKQLEFLKIIVRDLRFFKSLKDKFNGNCDFHGLFTTPQRTYEATVDYTMRFMVDKKIGGMSWVEIPANKYTLLSKDKKESHCQLEFLVSHLDLIPLGQEEWSLIGPLRTLSFDIETHVEGENLPNPQKDTIFQIANMVTRYGESQPFVRCIFTLGTCAPIEGSHIISYPSEEELLQGWKDFVNKTDPDVLTGYNILRFDIPYILNRAKNLGLGNYTIGRLQNPASPVPQMLRTWQDLVIPGRVYIDVLHFISKNCKLVGEGAYKLGAVAREFLQEKKEDIHFSQIASLQEGSPETRRQLAIYCAKDAYLPQRLMEVLKCLENRVGIARGLYTPFNGLNHPESIRLPSALVTANQINQVVVDLR